MAITGITSIYNRWSPSNPVKDGYAYGAGIGLDVSKSDGNVTYNMHATASDWTGDPLSQVRIQLGQVLVPGDPTANPPVADIKMPTMSELMSIPAPSLPPNPTVQDLYDAIGQILDSYAVQHPAFSGGSVTGSA